MVRKHQKFQKNFLKTLKQLLRKPTTNNYNHCELLKENSPREVSNKQPQINYKSTCNNKCETTRAKNTTKQKVSQLS